jgi:glyoxylase-like metal-dependent hydrolase (beta-lactamase superfamily II)
MASLMLYCEDMRLLVSADALWENGFGVIFPEIDGDHASQGEAFAAQHATLEMIATLDVGTVIPGHGAPFTGIDAALERAFGRLDYFIAHPERHARNGLKVALSFLLMIERRIELALLPQRLAALPLAMRINDTHYQLAPAALAQFVVAELEKGGAAHRRDGWLVSGKQQAASG